MDPIGKYESALVYDCSDRNLCAVTRIARRFDIHREME